MTGLAARLQVPIVAVLRLVEAGFIVAGPARGSGRSRMISAEECDRAERLWRAARAVGLPIAYAFRPNVHLDRDGRLIFEPQEALSA